MPTIREIFRQSCVHATLYRQQRLIRETYLRAYPTIIAVLQCIDGRVKFRVCTKTPPGIITPMRSPAGYANACWPAFKGQLRTWAESSPHFKCFIATFHFSGSDNAHLGCAAVGKDLTKARDIADALAEQLNRINAMSPLYAIAVGIDTDDGSLVFRSPRGQEIGTKDLVGKSDEDLLETLYELYPECPRQIRLDLLPLVKGNIEFVAERRGLLVDDLDHQETMIGIAGGLGSFDWLNQDMALIVSTINMGELEKSLVTAATVLQGNLRRWESDLRKQHMLQRGVVLMSCVPHWADSRIDILQAEEEARYYQDEAIKIVRVGFPDLFKRLDLLAATIDMGSRTLSVVTKKRRRHQR